MMDFNFAKSYIKEKPKSSLLNVLLPVTVIGLLGGITLLCVASFLDLRSYQSATKELQAEMSSPEFTAAYSKANKLGGEISQLQLDYSNLGFFDYVLQERDYCTTRFFSILVRTSMEGVYSTGFAIGPDGTVAINGTADSMAHVAMMENGLRKDVNIYGVSVSAIAQTDAKVDAQTDDPNPYSYSVFFTLDMLPLERVRLLQELGLLDGAQAGEQESQPPSGGSIELPEPTDSIPDDTSGDLII